MFDFNRGRDKPVPSGKRPAPQVPPLDEDEYYFTEDYQVRLKNGYSLQVKDVIDEEIKDGMLIFTRKQRDQLCPMLNKHNVVYPPKPTTAFSLDSVESYSTLKSDLCFNEVDGE